MRWGVEYTSDTGTVGLVIFSADDLREANNYVDEMCRSYGFNHVSNLKAIPNGCSVPELIKLFPGYLPSSMVLSGKHQFRSSLEKPRYM